MDYALSLRYGNPSTFPQLTSTRLNIMLSSRTLTKYSNDIFLFKSNPNPSIFLSNPCAANAKVLGPVVLAHRIFPAPSSTPDDRRKNDRETERITSSKSAIGASFALACALGILCLGSTLMLSPRKAVAAFPVLFGGGSSQQNPMEMSPISGKVALRAFMDGIVFLGSQKNVTVPASKFLPPNVAKLKEKASELMKEGKGEEAVKKLKMGKRGITDVEGRYQAEMALVEILILQGKYKEASECSCLDDKTSSRPSDQVRQSLYKGIIYTILGEEEKAKESWEEFIDRGFQGAPDPFDET